MIETEAVIIAKGAPNRCRDGRTVMCAIALSESLGLIRVYPLSITKHSDVRIWSKVHLKLSISASDNRHESYRLESHVATGLVEENHDKRDILNSCILDSGYVDPIKHQDERRLSIAIVKAAGNIGASLIARPQDTSIAAGTDEDGFAMTQSEFPFKPYIEWQSHQGCMHKTHLVGQEVYMGMMNNQANPFRIFENMHIGDRDYEHWLVLGNMKDRRNVWVAAHVHRQKKIPQQLMFESSKINNGRPEGCPYKMQEAVNARYVEKHPLFNCIT
jgi:hypothetical protein